MRKPKFAVIGAGNGGQSIGLVPLTQLGQAMGVPTPTISAVVELSNRLLGRNYWEEGRSLKRLGLQGKTSEDIRQLVL
jgi:opine dehydrogenase